MAFLNDQIIIPNATTVVRQPLLQILFDGQVLQGAIKASVRNVGHFHADSFTCEFDLDADTYPAGNETFDLVWWGDRMTPIVITIQIGFAVDTNIIGPTNGINWITMITGNVDHMQAHISTRTMHIEGRDLSSRLIDLKIQEAYPNLTSSEIAEQLASQVGLQTNIAETTTITGRYYDDEHDVITNGNFSKTVTAWDLLTNLAQKEQFDVWVSGKTLNFQPITKPDDTPWLIQYTSPTFNQNTNYGTKLTVSELSLDRSLTLAKDVVVVVQSWNSSTEKKIKAAYPNASNTSLHAAKSNLQQYVFTVPNLKDTNEALQKAQAYYKDIVKNERIIEWKEPGDLSLTCRNMAKLDGTGSSWDGPYYIDTITRDISFEGGFTMSIRAKNQNTQTQTAL